MIRYGYKNPVLLRWIRFKVRCRLSRLSGGVRLDPGAFILVVNTLPLLIAGHVQKRLLARESERLELARVANLGQFDRWFVWLQMGVPCIGSVLNTGGAPSRGCQSIGSADP